MLVLAFSLALFLGLFVNAYVPALPTNSSREAIAGGLNVTDISNLNLQWYLNGFVLSPPFFSQGLWSTCSTARTQSMSRTN